MGHRYRGREIDVKREEKGHRYQMFCTVNGEKVVTATQMERRGAKGPEDGGYGWTSQLERYCEGYVDGSISG